MKININEIKFTIQRAKDGKKHPNLLAYITLTFKEESGEYFTISSFTFWKSKFGGYNLEVPGKRGFKYCLIEKTLWRRIKQEVIKEYGYMEIPIIEEGEGGGYKIKTEDGKLVDSNDYYKNKKPLL